MNNLQFTDAEMAVIYKLSSEIVNNTYLDPVSGKNLRNEFHSFNLTADDFKILTNINNLLSSLF